MLRLLKYCFALKNRLFGVYWWFKKLFYDTIGLLKFFLELGLILFNIWCFVEKFSDFDCGILCRSWYQVAYVGTRPKHVLIYSSVSDNRLHNLSLWTSMRINSPRNNSFSFNFRGSIININCTSTSHKVFWINFHTPIYSLYLPGYLLEFVYELSCRSEF